MNIHLPKITNFIAIWLFAVGNLAFATAQPSAEKQNLTRALVKQMQLPNQQEQLDPDAEATATANRYQTLSDTIKSRQHEIPTLYTSSSTISIVAHLNAIISVIELHCKNLINLITSDPSATSSPDSEKLNSVMDKLDKQRKSLLDLLMLQSPPPVNPTENPNQLNSINNTDDSNEKFTVYNDNK